METLHWGPKFVAYWEESCASKASLPHAGSCGRAIKAHIDHGPAQWMPSKSTFSSSFCCRCRVLAVITQGHRATQASHLQLAWRLEMVNKLFANPCACAAGRWPSPRAAPSWATLPPYEAFPIGGTNSVRGYSEGGVGSGRNFASGTLELHFPLVDPVEVSGGKMCP